MKKKVFALLSLVVLVAALTTEVNAQKQVIIDVDENPTANDRKHMDVTVNTPFGSIRMEGCHSSGGNCLATVVIN